MRRLYRRWTVLFRGNIFRNLANAVKVVWNIIILVFKIPWYAFRWIMTVTLWIFGIDWYRIERDVYRKVRAYFA